MQEQDARNRTLMAEQQKNMQQNAATGTAAGRTVAP